MSKMEFYTNNGTVKRYKKQRKSKAKNPKQQYTEYETVTIDLGKQSEFEHGQQVVIISCEDYATIMEELHAKHGHGHQLQEDTKEDPTPKNNDVTNDVTNQELHNQLLAMDNARIKLEAVQRELATYKDMAIDWNGQLLGMEPIINKLIDEVIEATKKAYDVEINKTMEDNQRALHGLLANIEDMHQDNLEAYKNYNIAIAGNIDETVEATNNEIRNTSTWQMIRHKKDINLQVPTSDLKEAPPNIKNLSLVNNAHVLDKLQSKPNFGNVNIAKLKHDLVNVPQLETLAVKSTPKNND